MTIHPLVLLAVIAAFLGLMLAYVGAAARAAVLQATVQAMLPLYEAMARAVDAEGKRGA